MSHTTDNHAHQLVAHPRRVKYVMHRQWYIDNPLVLGHGCNWSHDTALMRAAMRKNTFIYVVLP